MSKMTDKQLKKLAAMPDEDIDYSDIPPVTDFTNWKRMYPDATKDTVITEKMMFEALSRAFEEESEKVPVTIKLDRKVIDFFKEHSKKYQVKINEVLLAFVKTYEQSLNHKKAS